MKQFLAFIILSALVFQNFTNVLIVADYYINTASYAKNCINKAKPKLRCKGKCQMMKQLQEEEKKEQQKAEHKGGFKNEVISSKSFYASVEPVCFVRITVTHFDTDEDKIFSTSRSIFHPPNA